MELKNNDISFEHCVETEMDALIVLENVQRKRNLRESEAAGYFDTSPIAAFNFTEVSFAAARKIKSLSLIFIGSILTVLLSISGCSDMPYTGSILTADDVIDQYLVSTENGRVCLQNGTDSACLITLAPKRRGGADSVNSPIIHIHPRKLIYVFYHENKQIVHAEKAMDTTEIVEALTDQLPTDDQSGGSSGNSGAALPPPSRIATTIGKSHGDSQVGEINQYLANPLVVKVLDQHGAPLSGVIVNFSVSPSSGFLSLTSAITGSNGEASTTLRLGNTAGTYIVTASVPGIVQRVIFIATATDPPRATTLDGVSGNSQQGETNQHLRNPLVVRVLDQHGALLSGVTVSFTVSPNSGTLSPVSVTTDSNGEASTILRLGNTPGTYTVTASVPGVTPQITFTATATEPPPPPPPSRTATTLEGVSGDSQRGETNQYLANPLVVKVLDQHGALLSGVTVSFTVSPNSGMLNPTSATTDSNGEASTTLRLGNTAGTYTVTVSVPGVDQQITFTATATDPPRATTLEGVSGNSQQGETNQHLRNPLVVRVLDQHGAPLSGVTVSFTVSPNSGTLSPVSATTDSNGEASTILRLGNTPGTYTVTASVSGVTQPVSFTATATEPSPRSPSDDDSNDNGGNDGNSNQQSLVENDGGEQSHYSFEQGWLVRIYYPENYKGPRAGPKALDQAGFEINGFKITVNGGTVTAFAQTEGPCYDANKPCHIGTANDPDNSTTYSVQIFVKTDLPRTTFKVEWDHKTENWDGSPPPDVIYTLDSDKNTMTALDLD